MAWTSTPKKDEFMRICGHIVTPSIVTEFHSYLGRRPDVTEIQICGNVTDIGAVESINPRQGRVTREMAVIDSVCHKPGKIRPEERLGMKLGKWQRWLDEYHQMVYQELSDRDAVKAGELDA